MKKNSVYAHSGQHLLAAALLRLYPTAILGEGANTNSDDFFYDIQIEKSLKPNNLFLIENEISKFISLSITYQCLELKLHEAISLFSLLKQKFKLELLNKFNIEVINIYKYGNYVDICNQPHVAINQIKALKLLNVSSSYWQSHKSNVSLQRISGAAFNSIENLKQYFDNIQEAQKRDHRNFGSALNMFSVSNPLIGPGLNIWLPNGAIIRSLMEDYLKKIHLLNDYKLIYSPHIASLDLWKTSGHWSFYKENMYPPMIVDKTSYALKPMNCPFHIVSFKNQTHSYRELPIRLAEFGTVYRYELPGTIHGLMRLRGFTQDDAHIFCKQDQIDGELSNIIQLALTILKKFGFSNFETTISTRPLHFIGSIKQWNLAEDSLKKAVKSHNLAFDIDEGNGAFYGPKIDIKLKDSLNRLWQCSTIQLDFINACQFNAHFTNKAGQNEHPIIIHRALLGSFERFIGILLEENNGALPFWLAPEQIRILNISTEHIPFSNSIEHILKYEGFRVTSNHKSEPLSSKIKDAYIHKVPIILTIGNKEIIENKVSLRLRNSSKNESLELNSLIAYLKNL